MADAALYPPKGGEDRPRGRSGEAAVLAARGGGGWAGRGGWLSTNEELTDWAGSGGGAVL